MSDHDIYRDGKVHICKEMCSTCIFRPGNLMNLERGRVAGMVKEAIANESTVVCHDTLGEEGNAGCRGFFDRYARDVAPIRAAIAFDIIEEVTP